MNTSPAAGLGIGIGAGVVGSVLSSCVVWCYHYFYTKAIFQAFERASRYEIPGLSRVLEHS